MGKYLWDDGSTIYVRDIETGEVVASVDDAKTAYPAQRHMRTYGREAFSETDSDDPILTEVLLLKNRLGLTLWDYLQQEGLSYEEVGGLWDAASLPLRCALDGSFIRNILGVYSALGCAKNSVGGY